MVVRHPDPEWAALWPAAERRVRRALVRRHVPRELVGELLQETAVRLVTSSVRVSTVDELASWAYTVASRLAIDNSRRRRLTTVPLVDDDVLIDDDPASIVEARVDFESTMAAVQQLTPSDQAALLSVFQDAPSTRVEAVRWAVRRHRARIRLAAMLTKAGAAVTSVVVALRRLARYRVAAVPMALAPVAAIVAVLLPLTLGPSGGPSASAADAPVAGVVLPVAHEPVQVRGGSVPSSLPRPGDHRGTGNGGGSGRTSPPPIIEPPDLRLPGPDPTTGTPGTKRPILHTEVVERLEPRLSHLPLPVKPSEIVP